MGAPMSALAAAVEQRQRSTGSAHSPRRAVHSRRKRTTRSAVLEQSIEAPTVQTHESAQDSATAYDAAFVEAYERYYRRIFAFVYGRVGSVDAAKDLTADIFERAYTRGHGLRQPQSYVCWLFRIAATMVAGHYRQRKRESTGMEHVKRSLRCDGRSADLESRIIEKERVGQLARHVRGLPPRDQELLSLRFDAELTGEEIAQVMGMKPLNVRVCIHRALRRLRERLEREAIPA